MSEIDFLTELSKRYGPAQCGGNVHADPDAADLDRYIQDHSVKLMWAIETGDEDSEAHHASWLDTQFQRRGMVAA